MKEVVAEFYPDTIFNNESYAKICTCVAYYRIYKILLKIDDYTVKELNSDDFLIRNMHDGFTPLKDITDKKRYLFFKTNKKITLTLILL